MAAKWGQDPRWVDALPDEVQLEMAGLVWAEKTRCPRGHPLASSLDRSRVVKVSDECCYLCEVEDRKRVEVEKALPQSRHGGLMVWARVKNTGAEVPGDAE